MKFAYTIIYAEDVPATVEYYDRVFGLKRRFIYDSKLHAEMETGLITLAFSGNEMAEANGIEVRRNAKTELAAGFEVGLVSDDPEHDYKKAVAA